MAWYRVNTVEIEENWNCGHRSDYNHQYIGLYTEPKSIIQKGNFCGWYSYEEYKDTCLLAFYRQKGNGSYPYCPEARISPVYRYKRILPKVQIGSLMWDRYIEANNDEEAIIKFEKGEWSKKKGV